MNKYEIMFIVKPDLEESAIKKEADKLLKTIDVSSQSTISVAFWTVDIPELICIGNFSKEKDGGVRYDLDFSQTTLQFCFDSQGLKVAIFLLNQKKWLLLYLQRVI